MAISITSGTSTASAPKGITIRVRIANGHKPQLDNIIESNPGMSAAAAAQQWVAQRYGSWITGNLGSSFAFLNVCPASFDVRFDLRSDAQAFQRAIGGQEVADGA